MIYTGVLPVYKEKGYTSNDVVAKLRGILHMKKIGHTGTLDPEATGVLPVCLGKATALVGHLTDSDKTYECVMRLGVSTDTEDMTGRILKVSDTGDLTDEQIKTTLSGFVGGYDQIPPMYSAKKINGKKLYELAREGKVVERKPCHVTIHSLEDIRIFRGGEGLDVSFTVSCSKGTYIRSLCRDVGDVLNTGGAMLELKRTAACGIDIESTHTLSEIEEMAKDCSELAKHILPIDRFYEGYGKITVSGDDKKRVRNGNTFCRKCPDGMYRVYLDDGEFAAVYEIRNGEARICRYFLT